MADELDHKSVLRKSLGRFLEDLDPQPILDYFIQDDFLPPTSIRDIQELDTTSKKVRTIIEKVQSKGLKGYRKFKRYLRATCQEHLADYLETMEKKVLAEQKQKPRSRMESQNTRNVAGDNSFNLFGGQVVIPGTVNIGGRSTADRGRANAGSGPEARGPIQTDGVPYGAYGGEAQVTNIGGRDAMNIYGGKVEFRGTMNIGGGGDRGPPQPAFNPSLYHPSGYLPPYSYSHQGQPAPNQIQPASNQIQPASDQGQPAQNLMNLNQPDAIRNWPNQPTGEPALPKTQSGQPGWNFQGNNTGLQQQPGFYAPGHSFMNQPGPHLQGHNSGFMQQPGSYYQGQMQQPGSNFQGQMQQPGSNFQGQMQQPGSNFQGQMQQPGSNYQGQMQQPGSNYQGQNAGFMQQPGSNSQGQNSGFMQQPGSNSQEHTGNVGYTARVYQPGGQNPSMSTEDQPGIGQTQPQQTPSVQLSMVPNEEHSREFETLVRGNSTNDKQSEPTNQNDTAKKEPGSSSGREYQQSRETQQGQTQQGQIQQGQIQQGQQKQQGQQDRSTEDPDQPLNREQHSKVDQQNLQALTEQLKCLTEQMKEGQEVQKQFVDLMERIKCQQEQPQGNQEQLREIQNAVLDLRDIILDKRNSPGQADSQNQHAHGSMDNWDRNDMDTTDANLVEGAYGNSIIKPTGSSLGPSYSLRLKENKKPNRPHGNPPITVEQFDQVLKGLNTLGIPSDPSSSESQSDAVLGSPSSYNEGSLPNPRPDLIGMSSVSNARSELEGTPPSGLRSGLPSNRFQETRTVYQDVYDGRIFDVDGEWLENVIKNGIQLQSGSTGVVYRSKDEIEEWGIKIVVKKIKCEMDKLISVVNETVAARMRHQGIVPLLAKTHYKEHFYFVFPFMENGDLMKAIREDMKRIQDGKNVKMNAKQRICILYQIACTMLFIHTPVTDLRGIVFHGDITTRNLVLDKDGNVHMLDFGVARELKLAEEVIYSRTCDPIGTPGYTTVTSKKELSPKTDCKNFGVVILEFLTGEKPKDGDRELQKANLETLELLYDECYQRVWEKNNEVYKKLKELAKKCLDKENDSEAITRTLHDILVEHFKYRWEKKEDSTCAMCKLNLSVSSSQNLHLDGCVNGNEHKAPPVCVPCMRNSYLNPIMCPRCRQTIPTKIGMTWAAILITGYDDDARSQSVFNEDIQSMKNILTSKYPLIFGLSETHVESKTMDTVSEAVTKLKENKSIRTIFIYYSGHYNKEKGFQIGMDKYLKEEAFIQCLEPIPQDIILVMDCCFSGSIKERLPQIKLQLNATRSDEESVFDSGSIFTDFFLHSLKGNSTSKLCRLTRADPQKTCTVCCGYNPGTVETGFISVPCLFNNISKHMKEYFKTKPEADHRPTLNLIMRNDEVSHLFIAYHIDKVTRIQFRYGANSSECCIEDLPCDMSKLRHMLLEHVVESSSRGVDWRKYWDENGDTWQKYSDVIAVRITTGPHKEHKNELTDIPNVADAWNKKLELIYEFRDVRNIDQGKVGVILKDITTKQLVDKFLNSHHFNDVLRLERVQDVTRVTVSWKHLKEFKDAIKKVVPTGENETLTSGHDWLLRIWKELAGHQNLKGAQNVIMTIPSDLWNDEFPFTKSFLTLEIQNAESSLETAV